MKRGPRQIAPKKQALIRQAKMTKVRTVNHNSLDFHRAGLSPSPLPPFFPLLVGNHTDDFLLFQKLTSGLVTKTERSLATKAGHLELLGGGKKDKGDKAGKKK